MLLTASKPPSTEGIIKEHLISSSTGREKPQVAAFPRNRENIHKSEARIAPLRAPTGIAALFRFAPVKPAKKKETAFIPKEKGMSKVLGSEEARHSPDKITVSTVISPMPTTVPISDAPMTVEPPDAEE